MEKYNRCGEVDCCNYVYEDETCKACWNFILTKFGVFNPSTKKELNHDDIRRKAWENVMEKYWRKQERKSLRKL